VVVTGGGSIHYLDHAVTENLALGPFPSPLDVEEEAGIGVES